MTPEWEAVRDKNEHLKELNTKLEYDVDVQKREVDALINEKASILKNHRIVEKRLDEIIMNQKATIKDLLEQRDAAENKISDVQLALSGALLPERIRPCKHPHDDDYRPHYDPDDDDEPDEDDKA